MVVRANPPPPLVLWLLLFSCLDGLQSYVVQSYVVEEWYSWCYMLLSVQPPSYYCDGQKALTCFLYSILAFDLASWV